MMDAMVSDVTLEAPRLLDMRDRCDKCGAQAYYRARLASGSELMFCLHHGRIAYGELVRLGFSVLDETHFLE